MNSACKKNEQSTLANLQSFAMRLTKTIAFTVVIASLFFALACNPKDPFGSSKPVAKKDQPHQKQKSNSEDQEQKLPEFPKDDESAAPNAPTTAYMVYIQMAVIRLPVKVASEGEDLWSFLDEEPVSTKSAVLGLNGIRVGVGKSDAWKDVIETLKKMTGQRVNVSVVNVPLGEPNQLTIRANRPAQKFFLFNRDRTVVGQDFPPCSNLLGMNCSVNEKDLSKLIFTAVPQLITTRRSLHTKIGADGDPVTFVAPTIYTLNELVFQLPIARGDFIVLGPGTEAKRETSVGKNFFYQQRKGMDSEVIIILRPAVFKFDLRKRRKITGKEKS